MENVAPPLILLWEVKRALEKGQSVRVGIKNYLHRTKTDTFRHQVALWWALQNSFSPDQATKNVAQIGHPSPPNQLSPLNHQRRYLLTVLAAGLKGHGILPTLRDLEQGFILSCESEIQDHVSRLPLLALIPLMFLIFPAMMLLLVEPLLKLLQF